MNKVVIFVFAIMLACAGCASEHLRVKVVDNYGLPVSNALIKVGFSTSHVVFGGGHKASGKNVGRAEARTDATGIGDVYFGCKSDSFGWSVSADGYYTSECQREQLEFDEVVIPPAFSYVKPKEHEKVAFVTLWRKHNPQPMMAHGIVYEDDQHLFPKENGRYGFDLMKFDWLPPLGGGEFADFYIVRKIGEDASDGIVGSLEFNENCGMYIRKQTGNKTFPSTYEADTNAVFSAKFPFIFDHADDGSRAVTYKDIINSDEYGVLRTRVVLNDNGEIVQANYSKILGPFRAGGAYRGWVIYTPCAVFNPRINDSNLESCVEQSYDPNLKRSFLAP